MIKVTGIAGSPRENANSRILLKHALIGAEKAGAVLTETILVNKMDFCGCQHCDGCLQSGKCIIKDDMTAAYAQLATSDVWIFSTPVYYDNISGQLKLFFDRLRPFSKGTKNEIPRTGAFIFSYGAGQREQYTNMIKVYIKYLPWLGNFIYTDMLEAPGMQKAENVLNMPHLLQKAEELGANLVSTLLSQRQT